MQTKPAVEQNKNIKWSESLWTCVGGNVFQKVLWLLGVWDHHGWLVFGLCKKRPIITCTDSVNSYKSKQSRQLVPLSNICTVAQLCFIVIHKSFPSEEITFRLRRLTSTPLQLKESCHQLLLKTQIAKKWISAMAKSLVAIVHQKVVWQWLSGHTHGTAPDDLYWPGNSNVIPGFQ